MDIMKVYTHYLCENDIEYRWRTILQIGDSWEVRGTIFMKNPGSSKKIKSIEDQCLLEKLRKFDNPKISLSNKWYEFSIDNSMGCVESLFKAYYDAKNMPLNGIIQVFNLFNIRDANLRKALDRLKGNVIEDFAYTTTYDISHIDNPVYIGWGNLWKNRVLNNNAEAIFNAVKQKTSYLSDVIQNNKFYHPQYLMAYGKNREKCKEDLNSFVHTRTKPL